MYKNNITSLKESLDSAQDKIRDDLGLMGAENIRFFTYVTVIFLPLGFAVSLFSMGDNPDSRVLGSMAATAVVLLSITIIALVNAKSLNAIVELLSSLVHDFSIKNMRNTELGKRHDKQPPAVVAPDVENAVARDKRKLGDSRSSSGSLRTITNVDPLSPNPLAPAPPPDPAGSAADGPPSRRTLRAITSNQYSWHIGFWVAYLLIELPARRILLAYDVLPKPALTPRIIWRLVTGLLMIPVSLISWTLQTLAYNVLDILELVWGRPSPLSPLFGFQLSPQHVRFLTASCQHRLRSMDLLRPVSGGSYRVPTSLAHSHFTADMVSASKGPRGHSEKISQASGRIASRSGCQEHRSSCRIGSEREGRK